MNLKSLIRTVPDYPKPGIMFRDITTLLQDPKGFCYVIDKACERYADSSVDYIVGVEARGFILGAAMAYRLKKGFVPIRKKGKLPADVIGQDYELEYGSDRVEMHRDALTRGQKVILVDDLLATGGTALGSAQLIKQTGALVEECAFVIDLPDLKGRERLEKSGHKVYTMIEFKGD